MRLGCLKGFFIVWGLFDQLCCHNQDLENFLKNGKSLIKVSVPVTIIICTTKNSASCADGTKSSSYFFRVWWRKQHKDSSRKKTTLRQIQLMHFFSLTGMPPTLCSLIMHTCPPSWFEHKFDLLFRSYALVSTPSIWIFWKQCMKRLTVVTLLTKKCLRACEIRAQAILTLADGFTLACPHSYQNPVHGLL